MLYELADVLEATGTSEAAFRGRAIRRGAQAVSAMDEPAAERIAAGTLTDVAGIGQGIARRVEELVRTGGLAEIAELRRTVAPWIALLGVDGLGSKTAQLIHEKLGITTLDELEAAAASHQL